MQEKEADYLYEQSSLFDKCEQQQMGNIPKSQSGKTYLEHSPVIKGLILKPCLKRSQKPIFQCLEVGNGQNQEWCEVESATSSIGHWTPNFGECPNVAVESSLSSIIQNDVPKKYYLSPKACLGILRRARTRKKECVLNDQGGQYMNVSFGKTGTLRAQGKGQQPIILDLTHADEVVRTVTGGKTQTLQARMGTGGNQVPIIYARPSYADLKQDETAVTLRASGGCNGGGSENLVADKLLRRLTPLECERLQGLPDNWTLIDSKSCSDNSRYKAIGNGMAQPCADFVMKRVYEFLQNS